MSPAEEASVEAFAQEVVEQVRPKGTNTNAAVAVVILTTARAAAQMAVRTEDGKIDRENALAIFQDAVRLMSWIKISRGGLP